MKSKLTTFGIGFGCMLLAWILFFMPISKDTKEHKDISAKYIDNKYEIKIKLSNEIIIIDDNDIEVRYIHGYVSKNGTTAYLEEYSIKNIIGKRTEYKLIILESID